VEEVDEKKGKKGLARRSRRSFLLAMPGCVTAGRSVLRVVSFLFFHVIAVKLSLEAL